MCLEAVAQTLDGHYFFGCVPLFAFTLLVLLSLGYFPFRYNLSRLLLSLILLLLFLFELLNCSSPNQFFLILPFQFSSSHPAGAWSVQFTVWCLVADWG